MNLRKAAEMALNVLEANNKSGWYSQEINTLKKALAQPEQEPVAWMMFGVDKPTRLILHKPSDEHKKMFSCIYPLYLQTEALAQPKQEPAAYRTVNNVGAYVYHSADRLPNEYGLRGEALYLHPAPIPEGWQLVNHNMTPEQRQLMLRAEEFTVDEMWIMLLAAAPKPE